MRRIRLVLGTLAAFAGPAMADTQRCNEHDNNFFNDGFFTNDLFPFFNDLENEGFNGVDGDHDFVNQEAG